MTREAEHDVALWTAYAHAWLESYRSDVWDAEHGNDHAEVRSARSAGAFLKLALRVPEDCGAYDFLRAEAKRPLIGHVVARVA